MNFILHGILLAIIPGLDIRTQGLGMSRGDNTTRRSDHFLGRHWRSAIYATIDAVNTLLLSRAALITMRNNDGIMTELD